MDQIVPYFMGTGLDKNKWKDVIHHQHQYSKIWWARGFARLQKMSKTCNVCMGDLSGYKKMDNTLLYSRLCCYNCGSKKMLSKWFFNTAANILLAGTSNCRSLALTRRKRDLSSDSSKSLCDTKKHCPSIRRRLLAVGLVRPLSDPSQACVACEFTVSVWKTVVVEGFDDIIIIQPILQKIFSPPLFYLWRKRRTWELGPHPRAMQPLYFLSPLLYKWMGLSYITEVHS